MAVEKAGKLIGKGMTFALVAGRFNELVTESLIGGALDCLIRAARFQDGARVSLHHR